MFIILVGKWNVTRSITNSEILFITYLGVTYEKVHVYTRICAESVVILNKCAQKDQNYYK